MAWTPYQMTILLHHHASSAEFPRQDAPAYAGQIEMLTNMGLLHRTDEGFLTTTQRAHALIDMWSFTPLPVTRWIDPRFEEVRDENS